MLVKDGIREIAVLMLVISANAKPGFLIEFMGEGGKSRLAQRAENVVAFFS